MRTVSGVFVLNLLATVWAINNHSYRHSCLVCYLYLLFGILWALIRLDSLFSVKASLSSYGQLINSGNE